MSASRVTWIRADDRYPDVKADGHFLALDGEAIVGVVRRIESGPDSGRWFWSMVHVRRGPRSFPRPRSGTTKTRKEAERALVATWAEFRKWYGIED